jgi:hypothetical protein
MEITLAQFLHKLYLGFWFVLGTLLGKYLNHKIAVCRNRRNRRNGENSEGNIWSE